MTSWMLVLTLVIMAGCAGPSRYQGPPLYLAPYYREIPPWGLDYQPPCILERPMTGCREWL
jgi:hypothetical protein